MKRYHMSKNLFYKDNAETGVYIFRDGTITSNNAWNVSDYISVKPQTFYTISPITDQQTTAAYHNFYDSNKSIVSTVKSSATNQTLESPNNAAYVRISWRRSGISQIMLNEGSTALPYEEYYTPYWTTQFPPKYATSTDTITTLPADVYADGQSATVGLVGNMSQSGTPTPTTPIQPSECGERTGNLLDCQTVTLGKWTNSSGNISDAAYGAISEVIPADTITITCNAETLPYSYSVVWLQSDNTFISREHKSSAAAIALPQTFTPPVNADKFCFQIANGADVSNPITKEQIISYKIMLNTGSTALPYEPYGIKIPILNNSQTTNVYLGEVQTTRKIKKLVLTGEESGYGNYNNSASGVGMTLTLSDMLNNSRTNGVCSHFIPQNSPYGSEIDGITFGANSQTLTITFSAATVSQYNLSDLTSKINYIKSQYANGTPVTIWYVLAEPTTGIVNEPLRKIGDYTDEVSGITIPTISGADSFDVQTTLKPSEVELTYTGWHDATVKEWDGSQWD